LAGVDTAELGQLLGVVVEVATAVGLSGAHKVVYRPGMRYSWHFEDGDGIFRRRLWVVD
jgi:hypothetical protein